LPVSNLVEIFADRMVYEDKLLVLKTVLKRYECQGKEERSIYVPIPR